MQSVRRTFLVLLAGTAVFQLNAAPRKYLQRRWIPDRLSNEDYGMDSSSSGSYDTAAHNNYLSYYYPDYTHGSGDNPDFSGMLYRANDKPSYASFDPVQQLYDVQAYSYMQSGNPYINGPYSNDNYDYSGSTYQGYVPGEEYAGRARPPQQPSYPAPSYGPPSYQNANPYLRMPINSAPQQPPANYGNPNSPYTSTSYSYQAPPLQSYFRSTSQDVQEDVIADVSKADASLEETKQNKQVDTAVQPEKLDKVTEDKNVQPEKIDPQQEVSESQAEEEVKEPVADDNNEAAEEELSAVMPEATAVEGSSQPDASEVEDQLSPEQETRPEEVSDINADELTDNAKEAIEERAHDVFPSYPDDSDDYSNPLDLVYPGRMSPPGPPSGHSSFYDFPPQYGNRSPPNYPPPPPQQYSRPPQYSRPQPNSYNNYGPPPPQQYSPSYNSYPDYGNQGSYPPSPYPYPPPMNAYPDQYQGPPSVYDSGYYNPPTYPNRRNIPTPHRRVNRQSTGIYQIPYYG